MQQIPCLRSSPGCSPRSCNSVPIPPSKYNNSFPSRSRNICLYPSCLSLYLFPASPFGCLHILLLLLPYLRYAQSFFHRLHSLRSTSFFLCADPYDCSHRLRRTHHIAVCHRKTNLLCTIQHPHDRLLELDREVPISRAEPWPKIQSTFFQLCANLFCCSSQYSSSSCSSTCLEYNRPCHIGKRYPADQPVHPGSQCRPETEQPVASF